MMMYRYRQNKNVGIRMQEELSPPTTSGRTSSNPMMVVYSSSTDLFCNLFLPRRVLRQGSYTYIGMIDDPTVEYINELPGTRQARLADQPREEEIVDRHMRKNREITNS